MNNQYKTQMSNHLVSRKEREREEKAGLQELLVINKDKINYILYEQ